MEFVDPRAVLGTVLLVVQAVLAIPLIAKLVHSSERTGYSLASESMWIVSGAGWLLYGIGTQSVVLMISGTLAALTSLTIALLIFTSSAGQYRLSAVLVAATIAALICGSLAAGFVGLTATLSLLGVVQFLPQLFISFQGLRRPGHASGVSIPGAALRALYTLTWAVYAAGWVIWGGNAIIDWPLVAWGLAGFVTFGLQSLAAWRSYAASRPRPHV